jgi:CO dehydrogenase maturation factor
VLLRALIQDLVLHKNEALIMDFEAGVEHLGRASARGVDMMLIVVDPSRRSIDCADRVFRMARDIGLDDVRVVANKVASPADERFIRASLTNREILGVIPDSEAIRAADRDGRSVLDGLDDEALGRFDDVLRGIEKALAG